MDLFWQHVIVAVVVGIAVLSIARHFGLLRLPRRLQRPDVPVRALVRKPRGQPRGGQPM